MAAISARDPGLNSIVRTYGEAALAEARAADAQAPLRGLAIGVKENLSVNGAPWTAGLAGRAGVIAGRDAHAVARLRRAGAVVLASTNMDEAALGAVTDNPLFGRCINPLRQSYTPGGSSGGSAAAVAAGFVDLALGTDTLGSVRIPAAYCGIFGLKPTYGLIGRSGLVLLSPTLDTIGVLARDAGQLWRSIVALAGADAGDPNALHAPSGWADRPDIGVTGATLGVPRQLAQVPLEEAVQKAFDRSLCAARAQGARIVEIDLPGWTPAKARRAGLMLIEAEGAVALSDLMETEGALSPGLHAMLAYGRDARSTKVVAAWQEVRAVSDAVTRAFSAVDGLILPTTSHRAFAHGVPAPVDQADLTTPANFAGCPAVALPVPVPGDDLPASVQILGARWSEARLTAWAEALAPALTTDAARPHAR